MGNMMRFASEEDFKTFLAGSHAKVRGSQKAVERTPSPAVKKAPKRSDIEEMLSHHIKLAELPPPVEYPTQIYPIEGRGFHCDFAWPAYKIIVEVDGAVHRTKRSFKSSFERGALLLLAGWRVLHVGGDEVRGGIAVEWIRQLLEQSK